MLEKMMRRLGWVRRAELQQLLAKHVALLDEHEKMIRLAQALLKQTAAEAPQPAEADREAPPVAQPAAPRGVKDKLH